MIFDVAPNTILRLGAWTRCPNCTHPISPSQNICERCGFNLEWPEQPKLPRKELTLALHDNLVHIAKTRNLTRCGEKRLVGTLGVVPGSIQYPTCDRCSSLLRKGRRLWDS